MASYHEDLLTWHLGQHKEALSLCVSAIGGHSASSGLDMDDEMYSSEEDYMSDEEEASLLLQDHINAGPSPFSAARSRGVPRRIV